MDIRYAKSSHLFPSMQSVFCKDFGTYDALLTISNAVQKSLNCHQEVYMIGLDFSINSDCVNHETLVFKLKQLGVDVFPNIIIELLSNKLQKVLPDGPHSGYRNVISGVPQGSVLSPLLSLLSTHMWFGLENKLITHADNANFFASIPSHECRSGVAESLIEI
ncbi:uncharacterized protein [Palaemon carinicauda]|uniref:uncharacterized protein n=1 Tax=Palaemon carinicauda TaxID=392227 RepID=UPI0035B668EC